MRILSSISFCLFPFAFSLGIAVASAQGYPSRAVRFLVPNPPGGGTDLVARIVSQKVSEQWGVNLVVDNRPGAGGIIAVEVAAKSAPDGYTLLMAHFPLAITVNIAKVSFDPVRDFAPVTLLATTQNALAINPSVPAKTVQEFVALAKAKPGQFSYASGGNGTSMHVSAELFNLMAGVSMTHVPYKGAGPALVDLIGGQVQASFLSVPAAVPHIKSGKIRALAVTGTRRSPLVPDLPTLSEAGLKGYGSEQWYGVLVPLSRRRGRSCNASTRISRGPSARRTRVRGCRRADTILRPTRRRNGSAASSRARSPSGARSSGRRAFERSENA